MVGNSLMVAAVTTSGFEVVSWHKTRTVYVLVEGAAKPHQSILLFDIFHRVGCQPDRSMDRCKVVRMANDCASPDLQTALRAKVREC